MATYQELRARSQQVRDEQNIGGNTALRVGQLLMDIVKYFYDNDAAASEYLQQHFAMVNDGTQLLNWQQSPIVILHTMGETYDEGDFSSLSQGENYYRAGFIVEANGQGGGINGETPKANVLYVNLANETLYTWNGSSFDAITTGGGGSISGDDILKNAYYLNGNLVLVFETESGDKTVSIPVTFDASNYVPTSRTVNNKALSSNITLSQSDIPGLIAALAAKVGYSDDEWLQVKADAMQAATAVPNTTTVNGKQLNGNIVIGMADIPGLLQAIASAGSGAVSVTTNQDGTFVIHVGETDYTINLNHTHENMAKLEIVDEEPANPALDTIYALVDDASDPTEIQSLWIAGLEFVGGGGTPGLPRLTSPQTGSTIDVGINEGGGVSTTVTVKGYDLTEDLTVAVSGTGFSVNVNSVTANEARLGKVITITYSGTTHNATGTLIVSSNEVTSQCDLEADYQAMPAGYTRLQYISGITDHINTNINSIGTTWKFDAQCGEQTSYTEILAGYYPAGVGQYAGGVISGYWGVGAGNGQYLSVPKTTRSTVIVSFTANSVTITIGEDTVTRETNGTSSGNICLLGHGTADFNIRGNIYSVECTAGASFKGIPAERDSDNKQGIYDLANDVFYPLK